MRCHVKLAHGGGCGAAQIVMGKIRDRRTEPPVECSLAHAPASQRPVGAPTEYEFTVPARTVVENGTHLSGDRNDMLPFVFGPLRREHNLLAGAFTPFQSRACARALASRHQRTGPGAVMAAGHG